MNTANTPRRPPAAASLFVFAFFAAIAAVFPPAIGGEDLAASPWVEGFNNKVRLIAGKASGGPRGDLAMAYAGIEIVMPPGWKTYWRNPGEAGGVPPEFDFTGSENLETPTVLYPAPHRLVDPKAGINIGYKEHVVFPFAILAKDKSKPAKVKLKAAYGVCKDICVPAEAELAIEVPADAAASRELADVLKTVPVLGAPEGLTQDAAALADPAKDPTIAKWRVESAPEKPRLVFEVKDPGGDGGDAFLFSPDGLYLPMTKRAPDANGSVQFEADLTDGNDWKSLTGKTISITLVGDKGQSEALIKLP